MPSAALHPHKRATPPWRWLVVALMLLAPLLGAMRCANEDLSAPYTLELTADGVPEIFGVSLPYTGRLALDLGLDASQSGDIHVKVQTQTSGDPDVRGCDAISLGRARAADANVWDGSTPPAGAQGTYTTISNVSVRTGVRLPPTGNTYAGVLELAIPQTLVRIYSTSPDVFLWDLAGNIVPPITATQPASCDDVFVTVYELPADRTRIGYLSDQPEIEQAIVEDCTAQRIVQRVCPGASGPQEEYLFPMDTELKRVERLAELGVGDTLVVEARCEGSCPATVTAFAWVEPLSCRTRNDCSGNRQCTADGYCIKEPPPTCQSSASTTIAGAIALLLLLIVRHRRRLA